MTNTVSMERITMIIDHCRYEFIELGVDSIVFEESNWSVLN
jgi:hypothetical protein